MCNFIPTGKEGTKVYRAIQGQPKFHVDQSVNNDFRQNIAFPADI